MKWKSYFRRTRLKRFCWCQLRFDSVLKATWAKLSSPFRVHPKQYDVSVGILKLYILFNKIECRDVFMSKIMFLVYITSSNLYILCN